MHLDDKGLPAKTTTKSRLVSKSHWQITFVIIVRQVCVCFCVSKSWISLTTGELSKECSAVIPACRTQRSMTTMKESENCNTLTSEAVANKSFGLVQVKYKRMRHKKAIYFWNWVDSPLKKSVCELQLFARDVSNHISDTPLPALFLAHKAIGQLENTHSWDMGEQGVGAPVFYFIFDAAPTATRHWPHTLKRLTLHLAPRDGNDRHAFGEPLKPTLTFEMIRGHTPSDPLADTLR